MVHRESVVFEKPLCQRHLVRRLDERCAEVPPARFLAFVQDIERGCEELRPELLVRSQVLRLARVRLLVNVLPALPTTLRGHNRIVDAFLKSSQPLRSLDDAPLIHFSVELALFIEEASDRSLDFYGCQVLGSHRLRPRLLDDFLNYNYRYGILSSQACFSSGNTQSSLVYDSLS